MSKRCTDALSRAGDWFLNSGIQEPEGGVARYYRSDQAKNARVSTEITGYAVSFLAYLHQRSGERKYLDAALRAARFLTRQVWDARLGLFPFEHSSNGSQPESLAYFFDSGIIIRGLLALWRVTGDREFLDSAIAAGRGMIAHFIPSFPPILALPAAKALAYAPRWSASPGCYQLKSAMAWHDLFEETGDSTFLQAYEACLRQALQNDAAFLPGSGEREKVMDRLHAYAYFLEGLLPRASDPACAAAIRAGIGRAAGRLREIAPVFARSDVYAQILRLRLFADRLEIAPLDEPAAAHEADRAAEFQFQSGDARFLGGFGFGRKGGEMLPFVNPVSTAFCAQALDLWSERREGRFPTDRKALV